MAQSKVSKRLFALLYGIGAAVVILGALFKILHWPFANLMLIVGMFVEAFVFAASSFEPIEDELDWTKVYPELAVEGAKSTAKRGIKSVSTGDDADVMLSKKLDNILKEAKLDSQLVSSLGESIKGFQGAVKPLAEASQSLASTNKYNEEMSKAAVQLETLNKVYKSQVDNASKQAMLNSAMAQDTQKLQQQMQSLTSNLSSLNGVYGGMLTAMSSK